MTRFKWLENVAMFKLNDINIIHGRRQHFHCFTGTKLVSMEYQENANYYGKRSSKAMKSDKLTAERRLRRHDNCKYNEVS